MPKGGCVLGGDGLVGGGGLTSKVATGVTWWRRLNLEGDGSVFGGGGLASNMLRWLNVGTT